MGDKHSAMSNITPFSVIYTLHFLQCSLSFTVIIDLVGNIMKRSVTAFLKEQLAEKYKDQYSARLIHS